MGNKYQSVLTSISSRKYDAGFGFVKYLTSKNQYLLQILILFPLEAVPCFISYIPRKTGYIPAGTEYMFPMILYRGTSVIALPGMHYMKRTKEGEVYDKQKAYVTMRNYGCAGIYHGRVQESVSR